MFAQRVSPIRGYGHRPSPCSGTATAVNELQFIRADISQRLHDDPTAASFWSLYLDDWLHIAVFNFTVDGAGSQQIMGYRESSYLPWAEKMVVVLEDEEEHYENGVENLREFSVVPEQLAKFQRVYNNMLPITLKRAFGRPDGPDNEFCLRTGLKRHSTEDVINRYLTEMRRYL